MVELVGDGLLSTGPTPSSLGLDYNRLDYIRLDQIRSYLAPLVELSLADSLTQPVGERLQVHRLARALRHYKALHQSATEGVSHRRDVTY